MSTEQVQAVIIDDEQEAQESLSILLKDYVENVEILGTADSVNTGTELISQMRPQLVFLDVLMPGGTGFKVLENLDFHDFQLIFTTAYEHYAVKAIKFSAVDYLVKPIDLEELENAVDKVREKIENHTTLANTNIQKLQTNLETASNKKIAIPMHYGLEVVWQKDIVSLIASGSYTTINLKDQNDHLFVVKRIGEFEEVLSADMFFRINRSVIVNIEHVVKYIRNDDYVVLTNDQTVHVAKARKHELMKRINVI